MPDKILIDGKAVPVRLPPEVSLAVVISVIERALFKRAVRMSTIMSEGDDIFNAKAFNMPWSYYKIISCRTESIPARLKKAVVTLTIGDKHDGMREISHPLMKAYADKVGADFIVIDEIKLRMGSLLLEKWQMFDLLFRYDRLMFMDTDILVTPSCPDVFDLVPVDKIGAFVESDYADRNQWIADIQGQLGHIGWEGEYINSGVVVYSYLHKPAFDRTLPHVVPGDQHTINHRIKQNGFKVFPLSIKFNHMELCNDDRLSSYIVHYAGSGFTGIPCGEAERLFPAKVEMMRKDAIALALKNSKPGF